MMPAPSLCCYSALRLSGYPCLPSTLATALAVRRWLQRRSEGLQRQLPSELHMAIAFLAQHPLVPLILRQMLECQ